ncbi:hypothetical protein Hdeb2414_s0012g00394591 [Helianthus debilis subsp. tardiflorus]
MEEDTGKKQSVKYNKCPPPIWESYSPRKPNDERLKKVVNIKLKSETIDELPDNIDVTFTASDTDHESELLKKVLDQVLDMDEESKSESNLKVQVHQTRVRVHRLNGFIIKNFYCRKII